jgi:hypothetical protein
VSRGKFIYSDVKSIIGCCKLFAARNKDTTQMADTEATNTESNVTDVAPEMIDESLYPMEPAPHEKFSKSAVESEVMKILENELKTQQYNAATSAQQSKDLCAKILGKVKELGYRRYKFVVQVAITSSSGQGIRVASRCMWDPAKDNFASVVYKNVCRLMGTQFG